MISTDYKTAAIPHPDGFSGARDAAILESYDRDGGTVHVQCVLNTKDMLKRAGFPKPKRHEFYQVQVQICPVSNWLQLAGGKDQS